MKTSKLETLIQDFFDGNLAEENLEILQDELRFNPEARDLYRDYVHLQNAVQLQAEAPDPLSLHVIPIDRIIRRQKRRSIRVSMMAAAAVLVLGLISMKLFFVDPAVAPATLAFKTSPSTQFTLTHEGLEEVSAGMILEKGSRLRVSQGSVELKFASGVRSVIVAPADVTLHHQNVLYMNQGIAWFHVPEQAIGFRVKTKDLNIVDLGTEFGVLAKPGDHDELHVLTGKVKVTTNRVRKESATLTAGEARRIDPIGRLDTIPVNPDAFLSSLPKSLPCLHWSFDQEDGFQVTGTHPEVSEISTTPHANPNFTPGKHGAALSLDGAGQHLETDWDGFAGNRPRTVSFWLKIPEEGDYSNNPSIVGWGDRTLKNGKWKITLDNKGAHTPARIRLSWGSSWITARHPISPDQWQHITITSSGTLNANEIPQAEIYINGKAVTTIPGAHGERDFKAPQTSTITAQSVPLIIGSDLYADRNQRHFFKGEIDELILFDGHMTAEEVGALFLQ